MIHTRKITGTIQHKNLSRRNWKIGIEFLTLLYIGVEILFQEFQACYFTSFFIPIKQCIPLIEAVMLRSGLVLIVANVLFQTGWRSSKRVFLLYGICLLDGLTSFIAMTTSGIALAWRKQLMREIITVVLFYCAAQSVREVLLKQLLHLFYWVWLLVWSIMCCLSLCQFALMIGSSGTRITDILLLQGYGYYGHRLFGVFNFPEYAAVTSLLIMLGGGYYFTSTRSIAERCLLALFNIPLLFMLVLSGSRNAQVALYLCLFLGAGILCFKRMFVYRNRGHRMCIALAVALAVSAGAHLGYTVIQRTAEFIPGLFKDYSGPLAQNITVQSLSVNEGNETQDIGIQVQERLLERNDTNENIDTNRFLIWADYLSMWKEYGLFGLSSMYSNQYIQEHHPDLFICEYIRESDPNSYANGYVYHPHNGYLKTLVSTGYLGFAFLILFLFGCVKDVWKAIYASKKIRPEVIFPLLIVAAGCSSSMFDWELFFVFNPISYIFWLALGILMKQVSKEIGGNMSPMEITDANR